MNTMTKERLSMMLACMRACTENLRVREGMPAGDKLLMRVIVADAAQIAEQLNEVLQRVSKEVVLDADANIDYGKAVDYVMQAEVKEKEGADEDYREHVRLANEALAALCEVMGEIDGQLSRHHKEEEYARLYEAEKHRYMNSGTAKRTKRDFDEWKENMNCGNPSLEDMEDYRLEKVMHMFEKGVFNDRVEHMQRARRFPDELDFDQVDENHKITKTPYHHYAALRRLVVFKDGMLVVDPVRVGQHFFASRKDANAKTHRTNFLKYMHKISLVQEERSRLLVTKEAEELALPDVLATGEAMKYWHRLQEEGFVDERCQLMVGITRKQAMYIADVFSDQLQMRSKWKPFQDLWHINNLAQEKWDMQETGKSPLRSTEIDAIFKE